MLFDGVGVRISYLYYILFLPTEVNSHVCVPNSLYLDLKTYYVVTLYLFNFKTPYCFLSNLLHNKFRNWGPRELNSVGSDIAYYMQESGFEPRTLHFSTTKLCEF